MPLKSGAGADDHLVERKMLHPELLHEVCGFPASAARVCAAAASFGLKRRLVGLKDGVRRASSCWYHRNRPRQRAPSRG